MWSKGVIPYFIDDFSFDKVTRDKIRFYLSEVGSQTRLQFLELPQPPNDDHTRWVLFVNRKGLLECDDYYAAKFTAEGVQRVVVGYDCLEEGYDGLAAAVLALAGVPPEHNSPYRSSYITIEEKNILPDKLHLFRMIQAEDWPFVKLDPEYDLSSASHYDFYKYSSNGLMTIHPKVPPSQKQNGLSSRDLLKLKSVYNYKSEDDIAFQQDCSKMFRVGTKFKESESLNHIKNTETTNPDKLKFVSDRSKIVTVVLNIFPFMNSNTKVPSTK